MPKKSLKKSGSKRPRKQSSNRSTGKSRAGKANAPRLDIPLDELKSIIGRVKDGQKVSADDVDKLDGAVDTLAALTQEIEAKGTTIARLRKLLFGSSSEKTSRILADKGKQDESESDEGEEKSENTDEISASNGNENGESNGEKDGQRRKDKPVKGHGKNGADDYTGAERIEVPHETLKHTDPCPECKSGKVYRQKDPAVRVRVTGVAPLSAKVYRLERLRCNLCSEVFTAKEPEGVGSRKYDETATAMIMLLKYGCGVPFYRLEKLERNLGIPLPDSTQWSIISPIVLDFFVPIFTELIRRAASGKVVHSDDTRNKIVDLEAIHHQVAQSLGDEWPNRSGTNTSGIVSVDDGLRIAVFFTGTKHAGENLEDVLAKRAAELPAPIHMSDALSCNNAGDFDAIWCNCLAHARRKFVEVFDNFPEEVEAVLTALGKVYDFDATTKKLGLSDIERLEFHQEHSKPVMDELWKTMTGYLENKTVEDNSSLGVAIRYMKNNWDELTRFLVTPGAPLDNNICERALKMTIIHRKNSMFFKTRRGALARDICMSLIHTCELNGIKPFEYLVALQLHAVEAMLNPENWMPWNYLDTLAKLDTPPTNPN